MLAYRLTATVLAAGLSLAVLTACGGDDPSVESAGSGQDTAVSETGEATERTVVDVFGREVTIPATVESAAIDGYGTRLVAYAGAVDKLTSVAELAQSNHVELPYSVVHHDTLAVLPASSPGSGRGTLYEEAVFETDPDVIISNQSDISALDELQDKMGVPVIGISQREVFDGDLHQSLTTLGEVFGTEEHVSELLEKIDYYQADLEERTGDIPPEERATAYTAAVNFSGAHGFEGTNGSYVPFDAANVINVVAETGLENGFNVDLEQVSEWDPDFIFINPGNLDLVNEQYHDNPEYFESLSAVKQGNVYSQPSYIFNATNAELAIANAYYVGKVVYPERFEDIDIDEKADEIFEVFLGEPYMHRLNDAGLGFQQIVIGEE